jgi:hypothetical protein
MHDHRFTSFVLLDYSVQSFQASSFLAFSNLLLCLPPLTVPVLYRLPVLQSLLPQDIIDETTLVYCMVYMNR